MRRFVLPDFEKRLVAELQRQQHSTGFCDTLLQTEGISIPTHSCVVGALSLPLSRRLSASPVPPAGQKRKLQLHTLKPQTLVQLVGLLYSGELMVNGAEEQKDILAAACSLGLPDLVEGVKSENSQELGKKTVRVDRRDAQAQTTSRSFLVSTGTQTLSNDTNDESQPANTSSSFLTSQSCPVVSSECNEEKSAHELSLDRNLSEENTVRFSPSESSSCSRLCVASTSTEEAEGPTAQEEPQQTESESQDRVNQGNKESGVGKCEANKDTEQTQDVIEATHISIKVKLRRCQAKQEMWEVVKNRQNPESVSASSARIPENCRQHQEDLAGVQPSPFPAVFPSAPQSRRSPNPCLTSDDCSDHGGASFGDDPVLVPMQLPRTAEDADGQIDKLLKDIFWLNILPNINRDSNKIQEENAHYEEDGNQNCHRSTNEGASSYTIHRSNKPTGGNSSFSTTCENSSASTWRAIGSQNSKSPQSSPCCSDNDDSNPQEDPNVLELLPFTTDNDVNFFSMADLQFLPCLSPLDSNNNATSENTTSAQSPLPSKTWPSDNTLSIDCFLNSPGQKQNNFIFKPCTTDALQKQIICPETFSTKAKKRTLDDEEPLQTPKRKCPNRRQNQICSSLSEDVTAALSQCRVRLSSNNVLAKERAQHISSVTTTNASTTNPKTVNTKSQRSDTRSGRVPGLRTPIRTRNKTQQAIMTSTPNAETSLPEIGEKPRKTQNKEDCKKKTSSPNLGHAEKVERKTRKRSREKNKEKCLTKKAVSTNASSVATTSDKSDATEDNDNTIPSEKRPRLVSLKEFKELIKRQQSKTPRKKSRCEKERCENSTFADPVQEVTNGQSDMANLTKNIDGQNNPFHHLSQPANSPKTPPAAEFGSSSSLENNKSSDRSEFCTGLSPEEVTKVSEDMEHGQKTSTLCNNGVSETKADAGTKVSSPLLPSADQEHEFADPTPVLTSGNGHNENTENSRPKEKSEGCSQEDEEEVDVVLHSSPERAPVTAEAQRSTDVSPDEEEGEESNEVDVTGSETDA